MHAGNTLHVCPAVGSIGRLVVTWQWSRDHRGSLEQQTGAYAAALLAGQADGSLRAALRRRGWATAVEAYCEGDGFSDNDSYSLFQVRCIPVVAVALHASFYCPVLHRACCSGVSCPRCAGDILPCKCATRRVSAAGLWLGRAESARYR